MITLKNLATNIVIALAFFLPIAALANDARTSFKSVIDVPMQEHTIPKVYEVSLQNSLETKILGVFDQTDSSFEPFYFIENRTASLVRTTTKTSDGKSLPALQDKNYSTYESFEARLDGDMVTTSLTIVADAPIESSAINLHFDQNISNPLTAAVTVGEGIDEVVVISKSAFKSKNIIFPETKATVWNITLQHVQPLRISEVELVQKGAEQDVYRAVRFLGQPDHQYSIYIDADRYTSLNTGESSNLREDTDVVKINGAFKQPNHMYTPADIDFDGVPDEIDNCVRVSNASQEDVDKNGRGDACDDFDRDGLINNIDNCINEPNRAQRDEDGDGIGDECDGVESRLTERYGWLPWVGIVGVFIVVILLFATTFRSMRKSNQTEALENAEQENNEFPQKSDELHNKVDIDNEERPE